MPGRARVPDALYGLSRMGVWISREDASSDARREIILASHCNSTYRFLGIPTVVASGLDDPVGLHSISTS